MFWNELEPGKGGFLFFWEVFAPKWIYRNKLEFGSQISNSDTLSITSPSHSSLQYLVYQSGHSYRYWSGSFFLNFGDPFRTGVSMWYAHIPNIEGGVNYFLERYRDSTFCSPSLTVDHIYELHLKSGWY